MLMTRSWDVSWSSFVAIVPHFSSDGSLTVFQTGAALAKQLRILEKNPM